MARRSLLVSVVNASITAAKQAERERIRQQNAQIRYQAQKSREAMREWVEERVEEAESQTEELQDLLQDIDSILKATLDVDDFFDLEKIRQHVSHPQFTSKNADKTEEPSYTQLPDQPSSAEPMSRKIVGSLLIGLAKQKHQLKSAALYQARHDAWERICQEIETSNVELRERWELQERSRISDLANDEARYREECFARELEIQQANAELDEVVNGLPLGRKQAIETYAELVFAESDYPLNLEPEIEPVFDEISRELDLRITAPVPARLPQVASYKFQRNIGQIVSKVQTQKEIKERYENFICAIAIRSMHEILEADRDEAIRLISVCVEVDHISQATGNPSVSRLLEVATDRQTFETLNLNSVIPRAALESLGAALSKNFVGLVEIPRGKSIRKS